MVEYSPTHPAIVASCNLLHKMKASAPMERTVLYDEEIQNTRLMYTVQLLVSFVRVIQQLSYT